MIGLEPSPRASAHAPVSESVRDSRPGGKLREGWILVGDVRHPAALAPTDVLGGMPHVVRIACDLAVAGVSRIYVILRSQNMNPDLVEIISGAQLPAGATISVVPEPPSGARSDGIVVARADRVFHRDLPKRVVAAFPTADAPVVAIDGPEHDAVFAMDRATAQRCARAAREPGGFARELAAIGHIARIEPPYLGFTMAVPDAEARAAAERLLVSSLRKAADGIAAKAINRHLSLPLTRMLAGTRVRPNHVTLLALACALAGGAVIGQGGYAAGVIGMLLVELGSIIDGIDGELARLRYQFSRSGQWMDTVVDDAANVAYASGVIASLHAAGVTWALPVGVAAVIAFVTTQLTQYALIRFVYRSGDLAAIPWAFQSAEFLSQRPRGVRTWIVATAPKLLKRDFVVTLMLAFAIAGRLDLILSVFAGGAFAFFVVLFVQLVRNWRSIAPAKRAAQ